MSPQPCATTGCQGTGTWGVFERDDAGELHRYPSCSPCAVRALVADPNLHVVAGVAA